LSFQLSALSFELSACSNGINVLNVPNDLNDLNDLNVLNGPNGKKKSERIQLRPRE
jgi:hypothetical protein